MAAWMRERRRETACIIVLSFVGWKMKELASSSMDDTELRRTGGMKAQASGGMDNIELCRAKGMKVQTKCSFAG